MSIIELTLLSIVQGITEFLPVSSSAHLIFVADLLGKKLTLQFVVMTHIGSLIAIIAYYWSDILQIIKQERRTIFLIVVATIPAALAGLSLEDYIDQTFSSSSIAASLLMVTGLYLAFSNARSKGSEQVNKTSLWKAFMVGLAQAFALLPGLSRSGLTICTGLVCGWERTQAMRFSFLMAIPAIMGATILELAQPATRTGINITSSIYLILISFIFSMISLLVLRLLIIQRKLIIFAIYCILAGIFMLVLSMNLQYA